MTEPRGRGQKTEGGWGLDAPGSSSKALPPLDSSRPDNFQSASTSGERIYQNRFQGEMLFAGVPEPNRSLRIVAEAPIARGSGGDAVVKHADVLDAACVRVHERSQSRDFVHIVEAEKMPVVVNHVHKRTQAR